jgi:hypothetical protein
MAPHDAGHGREADARPGEVGASMEALERGEQTRLVCHVEADPVVGDPQVQAAAVAVPAHANMGQRALLRVLPGVAQQMSERDAQQ